MWKHSVPSVGSGIPLPSQVEHSLQPFRADFAKAMRQFVSGTLFTAQADPALVRYAVVGT